MPTLLIRNARGVVTMGLPPDALVEDGAAMLVDTQTADRAPSRSGAPRHAAHRRRAVLAVFGQPRA